LRQQQFENERKTCTDAIKLGLQRDALPRDCHAYPVNRLTTVSGVREQWKFWGGYLFFENGILTAIQEQ
jgi:hypothetical protein